MFERTEVDPVSRCVQCGDAVAAGGQETHRAWHQYLVAELEDARRDISAVRIALRELGKLVAELQQGRPS